MGQMTTEKGDKQEIELNLAPNVVRYLLGGKPIFSWIVSNESSILTSILNSK